MRLICLISAQPIPNLVSVLHLSPRTVDVVLTSRMERERRHEHFVRVLESFDGAAPQAPKINIWQVADEDDLEEVGALVHEIWNDCQPGEQLVINLTGGTKLMTVAVFQAALALGLRCHYFNADRPNTLLVISPQPPYRATAVDLPYILPPLLFFQAYGFQVTPRAAQVTIGPIALAVARELACTAPAKNPLPAYLHGANKFGANRLRGEMDEGAIRAFLSGQWLEVFITELLNKYAVALGLSQALHDVEVTANEVANQFDVVCVHGQSLTLIECKAGHGPQTARDLIEEMAGVQSRFKAIRIKSRLVSTWECLDTASNRDVRASTERLSDSAMRLLDRSAIQWLGRNFNNEVECTKVLAAWLG